MSFKIYQILWKGILAVNITNFYSEFSFLVSATITVFWAVTSYSLADWYNVSMYLLPPIWTWKIKTAGFSEIFYILLTVHLV